MHPQVSCVDVCKPPHPQHILEAGIRDWHSMVGTRVPQSREPINPASFSSVCPQSHVCPRTGVPKAGQPRTEDQPHVELGGSLGAHAWPCFCRVGGDSPTRDYYMLQKHWPSVAAPTPHVDLDGLSAPQGRYRKLSQTPTAVTPRGLA